MLAELKHIVARNLWVVGGVIARFPAFIVQAIGLPIGLNWEMAPCARCRPRQVTGVASHFFVVVRVVGLAVGIRRTPFAIAAFLSSKHQFAARGFFVVIRMSWCNAIFNQTHLPFKFWVERGALVQLTAYPFEAFPPILGTKRQKIASARLRRRTAGLQRRIFACGPVAIGAVNFDCGGDLAIDVAVTVRVL